jgi:hypothetical protein
VDYTGVFQTGVAIKENVAIASSTVCVAIAYVSSVPNPNPPVDIPADTGTPRFLLYPFLFSFFYRSFFSLIPLSFFYRCFLHF